MIVKSQRKRISLCFIRISLYIHDYISKISSFLYVVSIGPILKMTSSSTLMRLPPITGEGGLLVRELEGDVLIRASPALSTGG